MVNVHIFFPTEIVILEGLHMVPVAVIGDRDGNVRSRAFVARSDKAIGSSHCHLQRCLLSLPLHLFEIKQFFASSEDITREQYICQA